MVVATTETPRENSVVRELIIRLVCESVQSAVDAGRTPQDGGEDALNRLIGRGWGSKWLELFGPSAMAAQWRQHDVQPQRNDFYRAAEIMTPPAPQPLIRQPTPAPAVPNVNSDVAVLEQVWAPPIHGRESAVSLLSKDLDRLLGTNLRIAGIWIRAGELRRKDLLQMRDEMRERAMSTLAGFKQRRSRLLRLASYFESDADDLRGLVVDGRIGLEELKAFLADTN